MYGISGDILIIVFTSNNVASENIAKALIKNHGFVKTGENEWKAGNVRLIDTKVASVLEIPSDFETDCMIVLSTHRSKIIEKIMTAHYPGNSGAADMGGSPRTLNIAPGSRLKILLQEIKKEADRIGWKTSLEADHHGPTGNVPMIFAEIGSGEEEWKDETAAKAMANAIAACIRRNEVFESFFGVGGGHYPKVFTKIALETPLAIGHIAPKYVIDSLDECMIRQAVEKNVEKITKILVIKDETNVAQKKRINELSKMIGVKCEFI